MELRIGAAHFVACFLSGEHPFYTGARSVALTLPGSDSTAIRPEVLYRFLCGKDRNQYIDVELAVELILGGLFQR
jgi:hypothetical protein